MNSSYVSISARAKFLHERNGAVDGLESVAVGPPTLGGEPFVHYYILIRHETVWRNCRRISGILLYVTRTRGTTFCFPPQMITTIVIKAAAFAKALVLVVHLTGDVMVE